MGFYYIFGLFWALEFGTAFTQFVLAYSVVIWYFTPVAEDGGKQSVLFPTVRAAKVCAQYHLGSIAFGSFLIAVCRLINLILSILAKEGEASGNKIQEIMAKCL